MFNTSECAKNGGGNGYVETKSVERKNYNYMFLVMNIILMVFIFLIGITQSALFSSKTATGVISIVLPPSAGFDSGKLYYDSANSVMRLGKNSSGEKVENASENMAKFVVVDTQSANSAYVKFEISVLGSTTALSYNTSGQVPTFSDATTLLVNMSNGVLTLASSSAVVLYSYIFLDEIIANLQINESLTNATLQVKAIISLESDFKNSSNAKVYYNLNSVYINIQKSEAYTVASLTEEIKFGSAFEFSVTLTSENSGMRPIVKSNGVQLVATSQSGLAYNYKIDTLQGNETITIELVENTFTITITPTGEPLSHDVVTITCSGGDCLIISGICSLFFKDSMKMIYNGGPIIEGNTQFRVKQFLLDGVVMSSSEEYIITSDISMEAEWSQAILPN